MSKTIALFAALDSSNRYNLWVTDGTTVGTFELNPPNESAAGLIPASYDFAVLGSNLLFRGVDASGNKALWVTDGTAAGTVELNVPGASSSGLAPFDPLTFNDKVLFNGLDANNHDNLWVTDGTATGTSELNVPGAWSGGLAPQELTVFGSKVMFVGADATGSNLWVTDGSAANTTDLHLTAAWTTSSVPALGLFAFGQNVLFSTQDGPGFDLWVTDGTATGTTELNANGVVPGAGASPGSFTLFNNLAWFVGRGAAGLYGLWKTDGTVTGTTELNISGASLTTGLFGTSTNFAVLGNRMLFAGEDTNNHKNLWVTDGTASGTVELNVSGASSVGLAPSDLTVFGNKVLFSGLDSNGERGLWVTDGTATGTTELTSGNIFPADLTVLGNEVLFSGSDSHNNTTFWVTDGTAAGTSEQVSLSSLGASNFDQVVHGFIPLTVTCFRAGTHVRASDCYTRIEDMKIGDLVVTKHSGIVPIKWIECRYIECRLHPQPRDVWPVRIATGAFAPAVPTCDLWLSPDHAIFFDDMLIPVKYLINGGTIAQEACDEVTYYHIELAEHDIIFAEGLEVESYLDVTDRSNYENGGKIIQLFPNFSMRSQNTLALWEACGAAPLQISGPKLTVTQEKLRARSKIGNTIRRTKGVNERVERGGRLL